SLSKSRFDHGAQGDSLARGNLPRLVEELAGNLDRSFHMGNNIMLAIYPYRYIVHSFLPSTFRPRRAARGYRCGTRGPGRALLLLLQRGVPIQNDADRRLRRLLERSGDKEPASVRRDVEVPDAGLEPEERNVRSRFQRRAEGDRNGDEGAIRSDVEELLPVR